MRKRRTGLFRTGVLERAGHAGENAARKIKRWRRSKDAGLTPGSF